MSVHITARVWKQHSPETRGNDLVLLLKLADNADDSGFCWPSDEVLTDDTGLEERQLRRAKRNLEDLHEISLIAGNGRGHISVYHVLTGLSPEQRQSAIDSLPLRAEELAEMLRTRRQKRGHINPPLSEERGTNRVVKGGQIVSLKGDNAISVEGSVLRSDPLNHHVTVIEPPPPTPHTPSAGGGGGEEIYHPESATLLAAAGAKRPDAIRSASRLRPDRVRQILTDDREAGRRVGSSLQRCIAEADSPDIAALIAAGATPAALDEPPPSDDLIWLLPPSERPIWLARWRRAETPAEKRETLARIQREYPQGA